MRTMTPVGSLRAIFLGGILIASTNMTSAQTAAPERDFGGDVAFLRKHTPVIVLGEGDARVAVCPAYQGRVMTSTADGEKGYSYGWINDELIASGKTGPHINVFGGEDRFWLGPEGGQYAIFFKPGDKFDLEHWQTPAAIDTEAYAVAAQDKTQVSFTHAATLTNYSGTTLKVKIDRTIKLLSAGEATRALGMAPGGVKMVAYESQNKITNAGDQSWTREGGLLSIWILGMFKHSPAATVVLPYVDGPESERGPIVNDTYFGKVPAERLKAEKGFIYFKADGQMRTKIGVGPKRAKPAIGSYDAQRKVLTIVQYTLPEGATDYVNSMWELQQNPYGGDVVNSYNDGPPEPGKKPLGPFYELETSSPAAALAPGASLSHVHRTFHFEGPEVELEAIARSVLGVGIKEIAGALK
jgi:hypothetical protein